MTKNCPCRGCVPPKRNADCHSVCPDYRDWNVEHQKELDKIRERSREESDAFPPQLRKPRNRRRR